VATQSSFLLRSRFLLRCGRKHVEKFLEKPAKSQSVKAAASKKLPQPCTRVERLANRASVLEWL
jgi:hypothetical protein